MPATDFEMKVSRDAFERFAEKHSLDDMRATTSQKIYEEYWQEYIDDMENYNSKGAR